MAAQREWFEKDYYGVLGVSSTASAKEITKAYRKLARSHHPDAKGGNEERFKEVSAAYDVLGDDAKREEYDEARRLGPSAAGGSLRVPMASMSTSTILTISAACLGTCSGVGNEARFRCAESTKKHAYI